MVQRIFDILPPRYKKPAQRFYSRNSGRIKLGLVLIALIVVPAVLTLAYIHFPSSAYAAVYTMRPNADTAISFGWGSVGLPTFWENIDDAVACGSAPADDPDEIYAVVANTNPVSVELSSPSDVASTSQVVLWIYAATDNNDNILVELMVNGVAHATSANHNVTTAYTWWSLTITGSWTQADVDSMRMRFTRVAQGPADSVRIKAACTDLTYTQSAGPVTVTVADSGVAITTSIASGSVNQSLSAMFNLSANGATNVTGITVTETGTVNGTLLTSTEADPDVALLYSLDSVTPFDCVGITPATVFGAETTNFAADGGTISRTGSVAVSASATMCVMMRVDIDPTTVGGQTIDFSINAAANVTLSSGTVAGTFPVNYGGASFTTITPDVTGMTNVTDGTLTDGGRPSHRVRITGAGFGPGPCAAGSTEVLIGTAALACVQVQCWNTDVSPCSAGQDIVFDMPTGVSVPNVDGGTGTSGIVLKVGSQTDANGQTFFVYPRITGLAPDSICSGVSGSVIEEERQGVTIRINGDGFKTAQGAGSVSVNGAVATITEWGTTARCVRVPVPNGSIDGNVVVTANNGKTSNNQTFKILPRITSLSDADNRVRENDTFTINGDHFGAAQGTGSVKAPAGGTSLTVGTWTDTAISVTVPTSYDNATYPTSIQVTRDVDSRTSQLPFDFGLLPRITAVNPSTTQSAGATIQLAGDHFCTDKDSGGVCPASAARAAIAGENIQFGTLAKIPQDTATTDCDDNPFETGTTTQMTDCDAVNDTASPVEFLSLTGGAGMCNGAGAAWTDSEICIAVPQDTTLATGGTNIRIESNSAATTGTSNVVAFTKPTGGPNNPITLQQFKCNDPPTCASLTEITTVGGGANSATMFFRASMNDDQSGTLCLQIENDPIGTAFSADNIVQEGDAGQGACESFSAAAVTGEVKISGLSNGASYHWRARVRRSDNNQFSPNWVAFGGNPAGDGSGDGSPANADYVIDISPPTISYPQADQCADAVIDLTNQTAKIRWFAGTDASDNVSEKLEYCEDGTAGCGATAIGGATLQTIGAVACGAANNPTPCTTHDVTLGTESPALTSGKTYRWRVESTDGAGNAQCRSDGASGATCPAPANYCAFTTGSKVGRTIRRVIPLSINGKTIAADTLTPQCNLGPNFQFSVAPPEQGFVLRDASIEINGQFAPASVDQNFFVELRRGSVATDCGTGTVETGDYAVNGTQYTIGVNSNAPTHFKVSYDAFDNTSADDGTSGPLNNPIPVDCGGTDGRNCQSMNDLVAGTSKDYTFHIQQVDDGAAGAAGDSALNLLTASAILTFDYLP